MRQFPHRRLRHRDLSILSFPPDSSIVGKGVLFTDQGVAITCTRSTGKFCTKLDGSLVWLGINTPAVEQNGLLIEGPATNLFKWSQDQGNSTWDPEGSGPPANPTATSNTTDVSAPDGTSTASKLTFNATTGLDQFSRFASFDIPSLAASSVYTFSFWARCLTGTQTFCAGVDGGSVGSNSVNQSITLTTTWQRVSIHFTSTSGGSGVVPYFGSDTRGSRMTVPMAAQTVYTWGAQFELGPYASSYYPTTTSSATRAGDFITLANPLPAGTLDFTLSAYVTPASGTWPSATTHVVIDVGGFFSTSVQVLWWQASGILAADVFDDAGGDLFYNSTSTVSDGPHNVSISRTTASTFVATIDGTVAAGSVGGSVGALTQPATVHVGSDGTSRFLDGWIRNIKIGPYRPGI